MKELNRWAQSSARVSAWLRFLGSAATLFCVFSFGFMLINTLIEGWIKALTILLILGAPFVLVSLVRRLINAKRPYEADDFTGVVPRKKAGRSFPSRHAFSIFAIGTLCLFFNLPIGIFCLIFGAVLCFCRVALGIHYIRDVLCGATVGVLTSVIGALILL